MQNQEKKERVMSVKTNKIKRNMSKEGIVNRGTFYTIISGSFRAKVSQDDPRAIRRDWTSPDGKEKGTKY